MNRALTALATLLFALGAGPAAAQSSYIAPSVRAGLTYDDNVTGAADGEVDDMMLRVTPVIEAGYRSARGETRLLFSFDAEKYHEQTQLDSVATRHYTEIDVDYRMTPRLDFALLASTAKTEFPGDLLPEFGLELGRADARRTVIEPALEYRFTPRMTGRVGIEAARDELVDSRTADTRGGFVGAEYATTPLDTWSLDLIRRDFRFRPGGDAYSNIVLAGWVRTLSPRSTLTLRAGPRMTEVGTEPEVYAGFDHDLPGGEFNISYARSERVILGQSGLAETNTVWASYTHPLTANLGVRVVPSWTALDRGNESAQTARVYIEAAYRYTPTVSFTSSYQWSRQDGSLEIPGDVEFARNVVFFGVTIAFSPLVGDVPLAEGRRRR